MNSEQALFKKSIKLLLLHLRLKHPQRAWINGPSYRSFQSKWGQPQRIVNKQTKPYQLLLGIWLFACFCNALFTRQCKTSSLFNYSFNFFTAWNKNESSSNWIALLISKVEYLHFNLLQPKVFGVKFSLREIRGIFFTKIRNFKLLKMPIL